jgi:hypothetical protein
VLTRDKGWNWLPVAALQSLGVGSGI